MVPLFYFGNIAYWKELVSKEEIVFSIGSCIPKKSYVNRTVISTANGIQSLSIAIKGGRGTRLPLKEIEISYAENWVAKQKMALQSAYSKSPYYEFYIDRFHGILDQKHTKLYLLNWELILQILKLLKSSQTSFRLNDLDRTPIEYGLYSPTIYRSMAPYPQVFRNKFDFLPDLSILDLLFNLGPRSLDYLQS